MKKLNKDNKGFSLVELLVVIAIMVVLVGVIAPTLLNNIEKAREARDVQTLDSIAGAIQTAIIDEDVYKTVSDNNKKVMTLDSLYTAAGTKITDILAKPNVEKDFSGTSVKNSAVIYYLYVDGKITVFVGADGYSTTSGEVTEIADSNALTGKRGTVYKVTR